MGSWKIIATSRPLTFLIPFLSSFKRSCPLRITSPLDILPFLARRRITEREVTDFPHPDSPTSPRISPLLMEKETLFTAVTHVLSRLNSVRRFFTSNNFSDMASPSLVHLRIQSIPETVSEKIERENGEENQDTGKQYHMRRCVQVVTAGGKHRAPVGLCNVRAESQEAQRRCSQDRGTDT